MPAPSPAVTCSGLSFAWPDGTDVFTGLSLVIGPGRNLLNLVPNPKGTVREVIELVAGVVLLFWLV